MTETVDAACQIIILYGVIVTFGIRTVAYLTGTYIYSVMYIYGGNIVQESTVLILNLTGSVGITAVILIGITIHYDLRRCLYYRCCLLNGSCRLCIRRGTRNCRAL